MFNWAHMIIKDCHLNVVGIALYDDRYFVFLYPLILSHVFDNSGVNLVVNFRASLNKNS